jgi:PAS domain S-box-containing protein
MVPGRADWPKRVALGIGLIISAHGITILIAWYVHFVPLIQVFPGQPPTTRQGAFILLLLGGALALLAAGYRQASQFCAMVVGVLALLVFDEYIFNRDLGIDQLLGRGYVVEPGAAPGRISPLAALCYLGASIAFVAMARRRADRFASTIAGIIGSVVIAVGSVVLLTYLMRHPFAYSWGHFRHMSIQAAAALVLLAAGIMALAFQESRSRKAFPNWLPAGIGLGLSVGALGLWQALVAHEEGDFPLITNFALAGGVLAAMLVATTTYLAQKATWRSRELQEGKAEMERLFEASLDALLVTDRNGRIVNANQRVQTVFGYTREEVVGASIDNLVPNRLHDVHKTYREKYYADPVPRHLGLGLELCGRRKDGSEFQAEISLSPLRLGDELRVLAAVRDITERKHAQEALRRSEEQFRGVFETSPVGLALIGTDYRLVKVNPALCHMTGYSETELLELNPFHLTHPDDRETSIERAKSLFRGEIPYYQVEKRYLRKSGEIIWANLTASLLRDHLGRPMYGLGVLEDITERKQAQEALRLSEEQFRGIFEQGPIGLTLMGRDYHLVKVNAALSRMLGYSQSELLEMSPLDYTHPDDRGPTINIVERLFSTEAPVHKMEKRYVKKNGDVIWASLNASVLHDQEGRPSYGMGMIEDITERKRAEEELRAVNQRLSLATQSASMGVWEWDVSTELAIWDDRLFQIFGIPKKSPVAREDWERRIHPDDLYKIEGFMANVFGGKTQESAEYRIIRPDGSLRHISVSGGPLLDNNGRIISMIGIAVDITERKQMQLAIEASSRLSSLGMMAGGVAHEINNPLSVIHAMASDLVEAVATDGPVQADMVARKAAIIRETAERIARIVKSLRQISREGSGDMFHPASLNKIVADTLEICRAKFKAHGVELLLPDNMPETSIPCREVQIEQALLNLLQNAFDAVVDQHGERWVRLTVQPGRDSVVISVLDSGPGIPRELRSRLMEPFFTTKPVGKGTGLGLSLSKTIAEDHGGRLEYDEDHGRTRFSLVLPVVGKAEAA